MSSLKSILIRQLCLVSLICTLSFMVMSQGKASSAGQSTIWIEGEDAVHTNWFPGTAVSLTPYGTGTSGGLYLRLYTFDGRNSSGGDYSAEYKFAAKQSGTYRLWFAASPQNVTWAGPMRYSLDGSPVVNLQGKTPSSPQYGQAPPQDYFCWTSADTVQLSAGAHTLRLEVPAPRQMTDKLFATFLDAIMFTTDLTFVPSGYHPDNSPQPLLSEMIAKSSYYAIHSGMEEALYYKNIARTNEDVGAASSAEVTRKLMKRPLPKPDPNDHSIHRFGVHGMELPFVEAGRNDADSARAFELLARAGVDSLRSGEVQWHRMGPNFDKFKDIDYQLAQADKYGMNFMFTFGAPSEQFNVDSSTMHSTFKPEYEPQFREYLRAAFTRVKGHMQYAEYSNEVDCPSYWWRGVGPTEYVRDARIFKEELSKIDPSVPFVALGSTYARNEELGAPDGGRNFVRKCFDLGLNNYADAYSLHYSWTLASKDFPAFFRRETAKRGGTKPLINSEDSSYLEPWDVIRIFARNLFLYDFESFYYYLARDWFENGSLISGGLFDAKWQPKPRLLAYTLSVDAMKHRKLVGIANPGKDVEAYVLEYERGYKGSGPKYSIVMWKNGAAEELAQVYDRKYELPPSKVSGISRIASAWNWRLNQIKVDKKKPVFKVTSAPIVVYTESLPKWKLVSAETWQAIAKSVTGKTKALIPGQ